MNTFPVDLNTKLAVVYNAGKPNMFKVRVDVTLLDLKDQLHQINSQLNHRDTRRVDNVEYRRPSTNSYGSVQFTQMKLRNYDNMRIMFSIFGHHNTIGSIELDASLVRSFEDIQKSLIRSKTYKEIKALVEEPNEDVRLSNP